MIKALRFRHNEVEPILPPLAQFSEVGKAGQCVPGLRKPRIPEGCRTLWGVAYQSHSLSSPCTKYCSGWESGASWVAMREGGGAMGEHSTLPFLEGGVIEREGGSLEPSTCRCASCVSISGTKQAASSPRISQSHGHSPDNSEIS